MTTDRKLAEDVLKEVERQLEDLPTAPVAGAAWKDYGEITVVEDEGAMIAYWDYIATEHMQVHTRDPQATAKKLRNYGSLSIGELAIVVYSDKCCGTNQTPPRIAAGRYTGGLWVGPMSRLRPISGWMSAASPQWLRVLSARVQPKSWKAIAVLLFCGLAPGSSPQLMIDKTAHELRFWNRECNPT